MLLKTFLWEHVDAWRTYKGDDSPPGGTVNGFNRSISILLGRHDGVEE
jgi:hypothetical protein